MSVSMLSASDDRSGSNADSRGLQSVLVKCTIPRVGVFKQRRIRTDGMRDAMPLTIRSRAVKAARHPDRVA
jgi:hypothetical protein